MKVGRNDPCPCGSGRKYKRCHLDADAAAKRQEAERQRVRHIEHDGEQLLVSPGVTDEHLSLAAEHFRAKREGRGTAKQMIDFIQPLLDASGGSPKQMEKAMNVGVMCWNLAVIPAEDRDKYVEELVAAAKESEREELRRMMLEMIERHRAMFPEQHAHG